MAMFPLRHGAANEKSEDVWRGQAGRGAVGESRALGPPGQRSPAALGSLPRSPQQPAPRLAPLARGGGSRDAGRAEVAALRTPCCPFCRVGGVPASNMAAAVSGAVARAGWRLLQLRCRLPGEGAAEPGSGEGRGEEGCAKPNLGWVRGGSRPSWWPENKVR